MNNRFQSMRCGLLGEHLAHSFSPIIHGMLADYTYDLIERSPDKVEDFVRNGEYDAFNVTIPYKKAILPYLDVISPEAAQIGAVNTVVRRSDGTLEGYNTDFFGFDFMLNASKISVEGQKILVLGSGGASATVQAVLRHRGVGEIVVVGRSLENNYENLDRHSDATVIVNTTPVGMYPNNGIAPIDLSLFPLCHGVLDVIYNPERSALIIDAEERKIPCMSGLTMLVAQAVRAFELFTGTTAKMGVIESLTQEISMKTRNFILIGMPGCGKSTVGSLLAKKMGRPFFDADREFTAMHGITPKDAIEQLGEPAFRALEHQVLCHLGKMSGVLIACGGGAVTKEENYRPLHQNGVILYLRRELSKLSTHGRPLSQHTSVEHLYASRKASYERFADLTIDSTEIPSHTADVMLCAIEEAKERNHL